MNPLEQLIIKDDADLYSALSAERENFMSTGLTPAGQHEEESRKREG